MNGATCEASPQGYTCRCVTGFTGQPKIHFIFRQNGSFITFIYNKDANYNVIYTSEIKSPKTESSLKSITEINVILSSSLFKPIFVSKYNFHVKKKQLK